MSQYEVIVAGTQVRYRGPDRAMAAALLSEYRQKRQPTVLKRDGEVLMEVYGNMASKKIRTSTLARAIGTLAHNRSFTGRELYEYTEGRVSVSYVRGLVKRGILRVAEKGPPTRYYPTVAGWQYIEHAAAHGDAVTERRARVIRESETRFEEARKAHDPKRYKRGGGYTPEEYKAIAKRAGISRSPSNRAKGKLEAYEFKHHPPDKFFAYYDMRKLVVTTFTGDKLGHIVWVGATQRGFGGGKSQSIRVRGINGVMYAGRCNMTGGTYCNLRRMAATRTR